MDANERVSLSVRGGPNSGMTISLSQGAMVFGRGPDNDVDVDEETVSRRHAVIMDSPDGYVLRDLDSANGTYVNRDEVGHKERVLRHGDQIRLAGSEATFTFRQKAVNTVQVHMGTESGDRGPEPPETQPEDDGAATELGEREGKLLELLRSKSGSAIGREEIAQHVWPDVDPDDLAQNQLIEKTILRLRAHLHDDPRRPQHLITAGAYGYILV